MTGAHTALDFERHDLGDVASVELLEDQANLLDPDQAAAALESSMVDASPNTTYDVGDLATDPDAVHDEEEREPEIKSVRFFFRVDEHQVNEVYGTRQFARLKPKHRVLLAIGLVGSFAMSFEKEKKERSYIDTLNAIVNKEAESDDVLSEKGLDDTLAELTEAEYIEKVDQQDRYTLKPKALEILRPELFAETVQSEHAKAPDSVLSGYVAVQPLPLMPNPSATTSDGRRPKRFVVDTEQQSVEREAVRDVPHVVLDILAELELAEGVVTYKLRSGGMGQEISRRSSKTGAGLKGNTYKANMSYLTEQDYVISNPKTRSMVLTEKGIALIAMLKCYPEDLREARPLGMPPDYSYEDQGKVGALEVQEMDLTEEVIELVTACNNLADELGLSEEVDAPERLETLTIGQLRVVSQTLNTQFQNLKIKRVVKSSVAKG